MFDVAFSELVVIAIVALIVIGPEKLPKVARTLGALAGRMQRYVSTVKADIEREIQFEDLQKLQQEIKHSVESLQNKAQDIKANVESQIANADMVAEQTIASSKIGAETDTESAESVVIKKRKPRVQRKPKQAAQNFSPTPLDTVPDTKN